MNSAAAGSCVGGLAVDAETGMIGAVGETEMIGAVEEIEIVTGAEIAVERFVGYVAGTAVVAAAAVVVADTH